MDTKVLRGPWSCLLLLGIGGIFYWLRIPHFAENTEYAASDLASPVGAYLATCPAKRLNFE